MLCYDFVERSPDGLSSNARHTPLRRDGCLAFVVHPEILVSPPNHK